MNTAGQAVVGGSERAVESKAGEKPAPWGYGQERSYPMVEPAVRMLNREGYSLLPVIKESSQALCQWARQVAERLSRGEFRGVVLYCSDPGLVACVANKVPGLRAAAVSTVDQAARATFTLAANVLVVEMPGRTFFEIRQMLRLLLTSGTRCAGELAKTLEEMEGHANR